MNSYHYIPIEGESRNSKWVPYSVVAAAVVLGAVAGLGFSAASAETTLYTSPAVRTIPAVQSQAVQWTTPRAAVDSIPVEPEEGDVYQPLEEQVTSAPSASWAGMGLMSVAAAAGFFLGSRKTTEKCALPETVEVVIDDAEDAEKEIAMAAVMGKTDVYAIVAIGGHQYIVQPGQILSVDKLALEVGDVFNFEKVLFVKNHDKYEIGRPYLSGVKVTAEVLRNSKGKKIRVFKYTPKKRTRLTKGHRQKYTDIHITEVVGQTVPSKVQAAAVEA